MRTRSLESCWYYLEFVGNDAGLSQLTNSSPIGMIFTSTGLLLAILVATNWLALASAVPIFSQPEENGSLRYVETEEESKYCMYSASGADDRGRASCPPGYHISSNESGPSCIPCPFSDELETYMPNKSYCELCILCPVCKDGYEVEENCTWLKPTKCRPITTPVLTEDPSRTTPPVSKIGPESEHNKEDPSTITDNMTTDETGVSPHPAPTMGGPESVPPTSVESEHDKERVSSFLENGSWVWLTVIVALLLVIIGAFWKIKQQHEVIAKFRSGDTEAEAQAMLDQRTAPPQRLHSVEENDYSDGHSRADQADGSVGADGPGPPIQENGD